MRLLFAVCIAVSLCGCAAATQGRYYSHAVPPCSDDEARLRDIHARIQNMDREEECPPAHLEPRRSELNDRPPARFVLPISVELNVHPEGIHITSRVNNDRFVCNLPPAELQYQNQFGGWKTIKDGGGVDLPAVMGGMNFQVIPNGRVESITAVYDGNPVGGGMGFGIGNYRDNGTHHLVVTVTRIFRDPNGVDHSNTRWFRIDVFNVNGN